GLVDVNGTKEYDVKEVLKCIVDAGSMEEVKPEYGPTVVCTYAKIGGHSVGIVANQRQHIMSKEEGMLIGGVIYAKSADKAARFVMDCNQMQIPIIFIQDVMGFMVGRDAEHTGIIRSGAKLVNALSNAIVPKITIIIGGSFGAGNYAMCGKAYDPRFIFAWPNAKYAVMGAEQASGVIFDITKRAAQRDGIDMDEAELDALKQKVYDDYAEKSDIRYGAARGWVDGIIAPDTTRDVLMTTLELVKRPQPEGRYHTGVIQT
ncbi:MAG: carboxyl transferase domain-containing protein, partial [Candidatus Hydrogenedentota bacterium]